MKASDNIVEWVKISNFKHAPIAYIQKNTIFYGTGYHFIFYTFTEAPEKLVQRTFSINRSGECADNPNISQGDGIVSYTGHRTMNLFVYTDNSAKIFIMTYPEFSTVKMLQKERTTDVPPANLNWILFSDSSLLFTLSSWPEFKLFVWNWRRSELVAEETLLIFSESQVLRCSLGGMPCFLAQLEVRKSSLEISTVGRQQQRLHVWEAYNCCKRGVLTKYEVTFDGDATLTDLCWSSEGSLFVVNSDGDVLMMQTDHHLQLVVTHHKPIPAPSPFSQPSICWYKSGFMIHTNDQLEHYKKSGDWHLNWTSNSYTEKFPEPIVQILNESRGGDYPIALTANHNLYKWNFDGHSPLSNYTNNIRDFVLVYPKCEEFLTLSGSDLLQLFRLENGQLITSLRISNHEIVAITENPVFPYAALGTKSGKCILISAFDATKLEIICELNLSRSPLDTIRFYRSGREFVAANMEYGEFFIVQGVPGERMEVVGCVQAGCQFADVTLVISPDCYRLFTIPCAEDIIENSPPKFAYGNKIRRYCIVPQNGGECNIRDYTSAQLEDTKLTAFVAGFYFERSHRADRFLNVLAAHTTRIYTLEIERGSCECRVQHETKRTGHVVSAISCHTHSNLCLTYGADGLAILRDAKNALTLTLTHHRTRGGVKRARITANFEYMLTYGQDGTLVCTKLVKVPKLERLKKRKVLDSLLLKRLFSRRTLSFTLRSREEINCNWLDIMMMRAKRHQLRKLRRKRASIMNILAEIRIELSSLLSSNLEAPENEHLDLGEFNLDSVWWEKREAENLKRAKHIEEYLRALIEANSNSAKWIKSYFLDGMKVPGAKIHGLYGTEDSGAGGNDVENYPLLVKCAPPMVDVIEAIEAQRDVEQYLRAYNPFKLWKFIPKEALSALMTNPPANPSEAQNALNAVQDTHNIRNINDVDDIDEDEDEATVDKKTISNTPSKLVLLTSKTQDAFDTEIAISGCDARRFIEPRANSYHQCELQSHIQISYQTQISDDTEYRLRDYFNTHFSACATVKQREIEQLCEKNIRLRHIINELNYFSFEDVPPIQIVITDPKLRQDECPEMLYKVAPYEIAITPYISPSEQALLDAKAAEEERLRLLLLADDFRERALQKMMNGVLEVRWEDELRKEVPVPKLFSEKQPESFNAEDLRVVRDYEEKCRFLQSERRRYKEMLVAEYKKMSKFMRDKVGKFDHRLTELLMLKMRIDSAILQENLKLNRLKFILKNETCYKSKVESLSRQIQRNEKEIELLAVLLEALSRCLQECREHHEVLVTRERALDKAFRKDFQDAPPIVQELALRFYKKRGKGVGGGVGGLMSSSTRGVISATVLSELAKLVQMRVRRGGSKGGGESGSGDGTHQLINQLPNECADFLDALNELDEYQGIPPALDEANYGTICKHRRYRIELELRLKSTNLEIAEGESTLTVFTRRLNEKRERNVELLAEIERVRSELLAKKYNCELQMVVPQGLVEISMSGKMSDFEDAVLIQRKDVEEINKIIQEYGENKLRAMQQAMNFRRRTMQSEWEHEKLRMQITDLNEKLIDVGSMKVTKEIQMLLRAQARGYSPLRLRPLEAEVELIRASYENTIQERKKLVRDLRKQTRTLRQNSIEIDREIESVNVDVCEYNQIKMHGLDAKEKEVIGRMMKLLGRRTKLVKIIQEKHNEILALQTELELLRLKTFPTLKYRIEDD